MSTHYPISPSAIEAHECERKGVGIYTKQWPKSTSAAAGLGGELHKIAEAYLIDGKQPDELTQAGNLFVRGLPYLPPPRAGDVEGKKVFTLDEVDYQLIIDYRGKQVPGREGQRVVLDHKSSSAPKRYGLWGKEAFLANPQAVIYSTYDVLAADDDEANLRWLYYYTKGNPKAEPSDCTIARTELEDVWEEIVGKKAKRILHLRTLGPEIDPNEVDPNTDVCSKFGGCPYHPRAGGQCKVTTSQQIRGAARPVEKKATMAEINIVEKIRARKAALAAAGGGAPKEDKINPPEAKEAKEASGEAKAELTGVTTETKPARATARRQAEALDAPSDADIGRVVRFLLGK